MNKLAILLFLFAIGFACESNQYDAVVKRHYSSYAQEESFKIYKGNSASGVLVLSVAGTSSQSNTDQTYSVCLEPGDYFIELKDTYGDGWGTSTIASYLLITIGNIRIFKGGLPYQSGNTLKEGSDSFTVNFLSTPSTQWKYTDVPQTSNAWTQSSFGDASWSTATGDNFPAFTATTRYYRFIGNLASRQNIPALYTSINNAYGFVYYVQGTEVYRYHMPSGSVSSTTSATSSTDAVHTSISANKFLLPTSGSFVVAFEVHLTSGTSGVADPFNCYVYLGNTGADGTYGNNRFFDGVPNVNPAGMSTVNSVEKIFDGATSSFYATVISDTPVVTYAYSNGKAEWVNYYSVQAPNILTYGYPTGWTIYGSNDGNTWDMLDIQSGIVFPRVLAKLYFTMRANTKSYNQYKMSISGCSVAGKCGLGEWEAFNAVFANEATGLAYDTPSFTGHAYIDEINIRPLVNGYNNFQINKELPAGVTFSTSTGVISGTPTVAVTETYTITATSYVTSQTSSTQVTLNIQGCSFPTHSMVRFMKVSTSYANEESYTVTDANNRVYTSPAFTNYATQYFYYCFPVGIINVHLADSYGDGWSANSRLHIQMSDGEGDFYTISSIYQRKSGINDFPYDITYKIHPKSNLWTYSTTLVPNWYGTGAVSGFNTFDAANPPSSNGQYVWFFRTTVNMNPTGYDGFELRVKARAGYVVYINGVEFIRKNLPAGDITTSTGAISGDSTSTYRFISGPNNVFTTGSNTIAIGIVNLSGNNPNTILFDATLQQMKPNDIGRSFSVSVSAEPAGTGISNINDLIYTTYWKSEHPSKADFIIDFTYEAHRAEHFNKHCVTSSTMTDAYDPSDWAIFGSNDGTTFDLLGNVTNAYFSARTTTRCFYMPNNKKAYNIYRMVVTETAVPTTSPYGLAIAELTFSMVDLDQLEVPAFSLDAPSYTGYVGVPFPEVTPSSDLFSDFSISPALQLPLEIDTSTGSIRGTPNVLMNPTLYTISAKTPKGETVTTQVTLSVVNCEYPNNQFTILIQSGNAGDEMGFTLKDNNGNPLLTKRRFSNSQANYYPQCRPTGTYTLSLTDSGGDGWDVGYFRVVLADESVVLFGSLGEDEAYKDFNFYIGYLVTPLYASYQYLNSGAAAPTDWTQPQSSATSTWREAKPGEFGNFAGTTAYFRKTFTIENLDNYAALAFTVKTTYGVIVYINGEQVYNYNMPRGTINYNTRCLAKRNQVMNVGSSIAVQYSNLVAGTNVVCVEVHISDPTATNVIDFDSTIQLTADGSYRVLDGTPFSDIANDESLGKLFDNVKGSVYISGPRCVGATPTWIYNNDRREFISSYTIITGPKCNVRTPSAWRIEASNDDIHWSVLHEVSDQIFNEYSVEQTYNFYNRRGFNQYRLVATDCANNEIGESTVDCTIGSGTGFQLAELGLYAKRLQAACEPNEDGYGGAVEGGYAYKDCDEYYQGRYQALCTGGQLTNFENNCSPMAVYGVDYGSEFYTVTQKTDFSYTPVVKGVEYSCSISPETPAGITFDPRTGTISGRHEEIASYTFTITCSNSVGSANTKFTISFIEKTGLAAWAWVVMGVLLILIIAVVVFCIANRMKSKKNRSGHNKLDRKASSKAKAASSKKNAEGATKAVKV